jgi:predicted DNA-binding transcriptional regulator YafY
MRHDKAEQLLILARRLAASAEGMTLDEMMEAMEVSRSTAERMRDAVRRLFPQMDEVEDGPTKRFRIPGGIDNFFQNPTTDELVALNKAAQDYRRRGMTADARALLSLQSKVQAAMRESVLRRVSPDLEALLRAELIAVQAGPRPEEDPELLYTLRRALLAMKALSFTYKGGKRPGAVRKVIPYGIIFGRKNYLIGPELGAAQIKDWRLDRMAGVQVLADAASPPTDFSLVAYANSSFGSFHAEPEDVVLHVQKQGVDEDLARWRFHPDQIVEPQRDGSLIVRFRASGMLELAWHLFTWGNKIKIVSPESLRREMLHHLAMASTFHQSPTG